MLRAEFRGTRCYVAWVATRTGRLFFLRSPSRSLRALGPFAFLVGEKPPHLFEELRATESKWAPGHAHEDAMSVDR